jgi:hypothetical protein
MLECPFFFSSLLWLRSFCKRKRIEIPTKAKQKAAHLPNTKDRGEGWGEATITKNQSFITEY